MERPVCNLLINQFIRTGHKYRPAYDFDYVALDLLQVYPEESGVYKCTARNAYGQAETSATVKVVGKRSHLLFSAG